MLFPDDVKFINESECEIEIDNCSICPFSTEIINEELDYVGNDCNISNCKFVLNRSNTMIPNKCPLKNKEFVLKIRLKKE